VDAAIAPLSPDEIRLQLDRLLTSAVFANADRMSGFLRYIVERAIAGEIDQVKEYTIGVAVFGRGDDYDPRLDSIVRVEARRLRTKLDEYYAGTGRQDPILIEVRRGTYAPTIARRPVAGAEAAAVAREIPAPRRQRWRSGPIAAILALAITLPLGIMLWRSGAGTSVGSATPIVTIAVLPFAQFSTDPQDATVAASVTDGVTSELARVRTLGVVSHTSALQFAGHRRPMREIGKALNAELVLEGSVHREPAGLRVSARLVDAVADRKIWVEDFVSTNGDLRDLERRVAAGAAAAANRARGR
jgi:TolB-like protein